jgi:aldehyde:ferredoxin oxidoreductase
MPHTYLPVLEVDLTSGGTQRIELPEHIREEWVGGTGLGLYLLSQELRPGLKATDPDCPIYMLCGPLTGTAVPSSSDCALTMLNADLEHHVCTAHAHAFFGSRLRQTGWDGIIVRGRAAAPVYLWIERGLAELRPADDLWGADTFDTPRRLRAVADGDGEDVSVACIGPAGENLVWGSSVRVDEFSGWNTGGPGVVWGSKNLKAVVVRGEGSAPVHDGERLARIVARMAEETTESATATPPWPFGRRFLENEPVRFEWGDKAFGLTSLPMVAELAMIQGKNFTDTDIGVRFGRRMTRDLKKWKIEPESGWNCDLACHHRTTCTTGPMAGATFTGFAAETMEEVGPNLGIEDPATALMLCSVVDGYGMKAASAPRIIGMLMEAFNRGEIGLEQTGGIDLTWGNYQGVLELLELTVQRKGLGELIAQGFRATASALEIEHRAVHMKWDGFQDYDQRGAPLFLFQSQVVSGADLSSAMDNELAFGVAIKPEIGVTDSLDPEDVSYISDVAFKSARWTMWENCAGHCHFAARLVREATHVEAVAAATGHEYTHERALVIGERLLVLQRLIQLYLGFSPEEDFVISPRLLEPIPDGPAAGIGITADELRHARDQYYRHAGFSIESGVPSPESLARLGLDEFTLGRP